MLYYTILYYKHKQRREAFLRGAALDVLAASRLGGSPETREG